MEQNNVPGRCAAARRSGSALHAPLLRSDPGTLPRTTALSVHSESAPARPLRAQAYIITAHHFTSSPRRRGLGAIKRYVTSAVAPGAFLGSVSDYCAHHASCPIMVVKPPRDLIAGRRGEHRGAGESPAHADARRSKPHVRSLWPHLGLTASSPKRKKKTPQKRQNTPQKLATGTSSLERIEASHRERERERERERGGRRPASRLLRVPLPPHATQQQQRTWAGDEQRRSAAGAGPAWTPPDPTASSNGDLHLPRHPGTAAPPRRLSSRRLRWLLLPPLLRSARGPHPSPPQPVVRAPGEPLCTAHLFH
ncbi:hypothetical protein HU200_022047 [Digitaria exilis]|uniref:UspA domain-containing protein n=1 Tax=Digitaria exilis TaxID=1010633 RepID=A0A835C5L6_9POAL|nr:hypothetical protein HU200_022047 [Digitaria exilis]